MKIILENTSKVVDLNGVAARIWEGETDSGIPVHAFITRVGVLKQHDQTQFEKELSETRAPSKEVEAYPLRMVL